MVPNQKLFHISDSSIQSYSEKSFQISEFWQCIEKDILGERVLDWVWMKKKIYSAWMNKIIFSVNEKETFSMNKKKKKRNEFSLNEKETKLNAGIHLKSN